MRFGVVEFREVQFRVSGCRRVFRFRVGVPVQFSPRGRVFDWDNAEP